MQKMRGYGLYDTFKFLSLMRSRKGFDFSFRGVDLENNQLLFGF